MGNRIVEVPADINNIHIGKNNWQKILDFVDPKRKNFMHQRDRNFKKEGNNPDSTTLKLMYLLPYDNGYAGGMGAGLVSNALFEGGMDPKMKQVGGGPGRGHFQYETYPDKKSGHWDNYLNVVTKPNFYEVGNPTANQALYLMKSLEGDKDYVGEYTSSLSGDSQYIPLLKKYQWAGSNRTAKMRQDLKRYKDNPELASDAIIASFEKPKINNGEKRAKLARKIYNIMQPQVDNEIVKRNSVEMKGLVPKIKKEDTKQSVEPSALDQLKSVILRFFQ